MTTPAKNEPETNRGDELAGRLDVCLHRLTELSQHLREALVARDVERIWNVLTEQEQEVSKLDEYARLWNEMAGLREAQGRTAAEALDRKLKQFRLIQQTNISLAQSYLSCVRKAIGRLGENAAGGTDGMYTSRGRVNTSDSSRLVRMQG